MNSWYIILSAVIGVLAFGYWLIFGGEE